MKPVKPWRVFLSLQPVGHRRPAGADPFTYRDPRPSRWRASWWTRGTASTELYRSKLVATREEAVRLAHKYLERWNKDAATRPTIAQLIDTTSTSQPERSDEKKSPAQLDADIAEVFAKEPK